MSDINFINRLGVFVTKHSWVVFFITIFIVSGLTIGAKNLDFKSDYRVYFSPDNPQLLAFEAIQNTYSKSDNILFVVEPENGEVFTKQVLNAIIDLTEKAWQIPYSSRVDSVTNFQHTIAEEDDLIVSDLVIDPSNLTNQRLDEIKKIVIDEPLLLHRLISQKGHVAGVNVTIQLPGKNSLESFEAADRARQIAREIEMQYPNIKLHLTGLVMMSNAFAEASIDDNTKLVPIMYGIVVIILLLCLRSLVSVLSVVFLILLSTIASMGAMGWCGLFLTPTSAAAPIIILTLIVADCVHLLVSMLHSMRLGVEKRQAIRESIRINFQPICLTSLTTAIGFLSMNLSDAPPFRDLGNVVAMGAIIAMTLTLTLLPALLNIFPVKVRVNLNSNASPLFMERLAKFVVGRYKWLLFFNTFISIVLISFLPLNELNDKFVEYFDKTMEFRQATDFLNENMGGIYSIEYSLFNEHAGDVNDPLFLQNIDGFSKWLIKQPEVVHVNSIGDTYKRLNKSMHGDDNTWYKLPEQRELAAQYLLMYEMSLPYGLDVNDQINIDKSGVRIIVTVQSLSSNELLSLEKRINRWLLKQMPETGFVSASTDLMFANIGQRNIIRMIKGTIIALIIISVILVFALKSIRLGLISLIPNLVPASIAFGIWGVVDGNVGLALSVVTGLTLGVVVDDTIHFMSKYQRGRVEKGLDKQEAVEYAFSTVGTALWVTSAVLVSGFFVLSFSHFSMNSEMGLMTALTIAVALFLDLLFLPPLLMSMDKK